MPIKIPNKLPATKTLHKENIFVITETRALTQDIRPLAVKSHAFENRYGNPAFKATRKHSAPGRAGIFADCDPQGNAYFERAYARILQNV